MSIILGAHKRLRLSLSTKSAQRAMSELTGTAPQVQFWAAPDKYRAFVGGIGSGKTYAGAAECFRQPARSVGMVLAPTYRMLEDATIPALRAIGEQYINLSKSNQKRWVLNNGSVIIFRSAEDPARLRGPNVSWFWLDEAAMMHYDVWRIIKGRLRMQPARGWITTTPNSERKDWVYDLCRAHEADTDTVALITASTRSNPHLPVGFVEDLEKTYTTEWREREIEGKFYYSDGAMIQREWLRVVPAAPSGLQWVRYWDLAASVKQSADYTASVRVAFADDVLYIADGIRMRAVWPDVRRVMIQTMRDEAHDTTQVVEEAMHGLAVVQELQRLPELAHIAIMGYRVREDKVQRALPWAARAEQGIVRVVQGEWVRQFIDEAVSFPHGDHDDMVDAVSGGVAMLGAGSVLYDFM